MVLLTIAATSGQYSDVILDVMAEFFAPAIRPLLGFRYTDYWSTSSEDPYGNELLTCDKPTGSLVSSKERRCNSGGAGDAFDTAAREMQRFARSNESVRNASFTTGAAEGIMAPEEALSGALPEWPIESESLVVVATVAILVVVLLVLYSLRIPLPNEICDRKKIQLFEFLLRLSNEYLGSLLELAFGHQVRNRFMRLITEVAFTFQPYPPKWCRVESVCVEGVNCRVYVPKDKHRKSNACLIYIHGGGWCIMRPKYYDATLMPLIRRTGAVMVSIDYQLSPEAHYKTALMECERVVHAIHNKKFLEDEVDASRIILIGDSAGGNLTTVLCQRALRQGRPNLIKRQVLIYPVIHIFNFRAPSYQYYYERYRGTGLLNPRMLTRWFLMYLGLEPTKQLVNAVIRNQHIPQELRENAEFRALFDPSDLPDSINYVEETKRVLLEKTLPEKMYEEPIDPKAVELLGKYLLDPDFCPLVGTALERLAPAMIVTAGIDILRDEGVHYARRLQRYGVAVEWRHYVAAFHGVIHMPYSAQRRQIFNDISAYLRDVL